MIKKVNLNGNDITFVKEVIVNLEAPTDERGRAGDRTCAATIIIKRDADAEGSVSAFTIATNEDGKKNILSKGSIECVGDDRKENYSIDLQKYFVSGWKLVGKQEGRQDAKTTEEIVLKVGAMNYKALGKNVSFKLKEWEDGDN